MNKDNEKEITLNCSACIHKAKKEKLKRKIIESLKQLEGIKRALLSILKYEVTPYNVMRTKAIWMTPDGLFFERLLSKCKEA